MEETVEAEDALEQAEVQLAERDATIAELRATIAARVLVSLRSRARTSSQQSFLVRVSM